MRPVLRGPRPASGRGPGDAGQSTVELAVLLPTVLILMLAVVQIGLVARDYVSLHHATREAARQAAFGPAAGDPAAIAESAAGSALAADRLTVAVTGERSRGQLLTLHVGYRAPTDVPVVGAFIGDVELSTTAVVRVE